MTGAVPVVGMVSRARIRRRSSDHGPGPNKPRGTRHHLRILASRCPSGVRLAPVPRQCKRASARTCQSAHGTVPAVSDDIDLSVVTEHAQTLNRPVFQTVGLIAKLGDPRVGETLSRLVAMLRGRGLEVVLDHLSREAYSENDLAVVARDMLGRRCDLIIVVAGDGTFLSAARSLVGHDVPLLGVNLGRLGFLADVMPDEMCDRLNEVLDGEFVEERRFLLDVTVERSGRRIFSAPALNEAVTHKSSMARLVEFETHIDGHLVNSQRSDGLIVATPTGSTAYALSGGGPIVHPSLDAIVLVPICPHTLSSRPVVVGGESVVEVVLGDNAECSVQLSCDGQTTVELAAGDRISIRKRRPDLRLIHPAGHEYYATLRAKLHWGKGF